MSYANFVEAQLANVVTDSAETLVLNPAVLPNQLPPEGGGILTLADSLGKPTFVEIIRYASRTGQVLNGLVRGVEGTAPREWAAGSYCYQSLTAEGFSDALTAATTPLAVLHATALLF